MTNNNHEDIQFEEYSGYEIISAGFSEFKLMGSDNVAVYARKLLKLILVSIFMILGSIAIIYHVLDIGVHSSTYRTGKETSLLAKEFNHKTIDSDKPVENNDSLGIKQDTLDTGADSAELTENENEDSESLGYLLEKFILRKNTVVIYYIMVVLLLFFNMSIIKRIRYLWHSYLDQFNLNENLLLRDNTVKKKVFPELLKQKNEQDNNICTSLIITLYKSFINEGDKRYFHQLFKYFAQKEEDDQYEFIDKINTYSVWIIRMGIFGTLVGITIAFFELYVAMGGVTTKGDLKPEFLISVRQALLGNAIAVATSLVAHLSTLVLEWLTTLPLRDENNIRWLENSYLNLLDYPGFSGSFESSTRNLAELNLNLSITRESLSKFSKEITDTVPGIESLQDRMDKFGSSMEQLDDKFSELVDNTNSYNKIVIKSQDKFLEVNEELNGIKNFIDTIKNTLSVQVEKTQNYLSQFVDKVGHLINMVTAKFDRTGNNIDSITDITDELHEKLTSISENVTGIKDDSNRFREFISKLMDSIFNSIKNIK